MNWLPIALLGPFFWSITNHIDKYLLSKHLKGVGKGALILYSTAFSIFVLPIALFFDRTVFTSSIFQICILILAGILSALAIYLYLFALEQEETSIVMPFFQLIPAFGFFLGYLVLGEVLSTNQVLGSIIILFGAAILSIELNEEGGYKIRKRLVLLLIFSSLLFALYEVLFKLGSLSDGFWQGFFWQNVGLFIFGIILFISNKSRRRDFLYLLRHKNTKLLSVNILSEILTLVGNGFYNFSILLAPIALVMVTNAYQSVMVFIEGLLLSFFFPHIIKEKISFKHLVHKTISILIVVIGTIILYR